MHLPKRKESSNKCDKNRKESDNESKSKGYVDRMFSMKSGKIKADVYLSIVILKIQETIMEETPFFLSVDDPKT